jgi:hypothetical protein
VRGREEEKVFEKTLKKGCNKFGGIELELVLLQPETQVTNFGYSLGIEKMIKFTKEVWCLYKEVH